MNLSIILSEEVENCQSVRIQNNVFLIDTNSEQTEIYMVISTPNDT